MAHGVTEIALQIHQTLHGYAQGHQQLGTSIQQLRPRDAKTMLVLSDISGPGVRPGDEGYLTGYPLSDSKLYVIARTWWAPEMPRPGCVWTHSLLVDFGDVATLADPFALLTLFRRPQAGAISGYDRPLSLSVGSRARPVLRESAEFAQRMATALYDRPRSRVIGARPQSPNPDDIIMALWAQQWPRLRRSFRFCTLVGADRSSDAGAFDLQLYPGSERGSRARFSDATDLSDIDAGGEDWIDDATADLVAPDETGLRSFMRNIGGDIDSGREAFRPLCRLHVQLQRFGHAPDAIGKAVDLLDQDFGTVQAGTARALVTSEAVKLAQLDDASFDFVLRNLALVDAATLETYGASVGRQIWARNPLRLSEMLAGDERERDIAQATLSHLSRHEYLTAVEQSPQLARFVLAQKPELITESRLWSLHALPADVAFATIVQDATVRPLALDALLASHRDDLIPSAMKALGAVPILDALARRWAEGKVPTTLTPWLRAAAKDPSPLASFLSSAPVPHDMLLAIAHQVTPDAVPNDIGTDPWLVALGEQVEKRPKAAHLYLSAFILARALGWRSRNQAELAQKGFGPLYSALASDRLPDEAWQVLDTRLPWVFSWLSWDRCLRVRNAVTDLFVDRNLPAAHFVALTGDNAVFSDLATSAARTYRGRRFLGYVRNELEQKHSQTDPSRIRVIDQLIGSEGRFSG